MVLVEANTCFVKRVINTRCCTASCAESHSVLEGWIRLGCVCCKNERDAAIFERQKPSPCCTGLVANHMFSALIFVYSWSVILTGRSREKKKKRKTRTIACRASFKYSFHRWSLRFSPAAFPSGRRTHPPECDCGTIACSHTQRAVRGKHLIDAVHVVPCVTPIGLRALSRQEGGWFLLVFSTTLSALLVLHLSDLCAESSQQSPTAETSRKSCVCQFYALLFFLFFAL